MKVTRNCWVLIKVQSLKGGEQRGEKSIGYTNHWRVLNAKNYGVPQNRERVFVVSILGERL